MNYLKINNQELENYIEKNLDSLYSNCCKTKNTRQNIYNIKSRIGISDYY